VLGCQEHSRTLVAKASKTVDGVAFPSTAFAYVPDATKPSSWKLRLFDTPADASAGKPSVALTAAAALALSPTGFRGNTVQLPTADRAKVKAKVAAAWIKARAGRGLGRGDLPSVLKGAEPTQEAPAVGSALSLSLDDRGQAAFLRLSKSLPVISTALADLAKDLVVVPAVKSDDPPAMGTLIPDLELVLAQVKDEPTRKRIDTVLQPLRYAVPHNDETDKGDLGTGDLAQAGGLAPAQGSPPMSEAEREAERRRKALLALVLQKNIRILKVEESKDKAVEEERTVLGVVLEPEVVDTQKDVYSEDEIRKTAFGFMERYQQFGLMHKTITPAVLPLESYLAPVEFKIGEQTVKKGTWLLRVRVLDDAIWKNVKSGKLTGFSIGGSAIRTPDTVAA